jgi:ketosteroid isomerase-like protein
LILRNTARAMSQENVEIVRASLEAWNGRDMDALRERYAEDVVTWPPAGWPEEGPFVGRDTVMAQWERMRGLWDEEMEMLADYIDAADRVAVRMTWRDRGGSGADSGATAIFTIRGGRIRVAEFFWDHAEALEAVGLLEQDISSA